MSSRDLGHTTKTAPRSMVLNGTTYGGDRQSHKATMALNTVATVGLYPPIPDGLPVGTKGTLLASNE